MLATFCASWAKVVADNELPTTFPQSIQQGRLWTFDFQYEHTEAQQDTSFVSVFFNQQNTQVLADETGNGIDQDTSNFFTALAQFMAVWPDLQNDLGTLLAPGGDATLQTAAVNTFAQLVQNVANTWTYNLNSAKPPSVAAEEFEYAMTTTVMPGVYNDEEDVPLYHTLTMTAQTEGIGPNGQFPEVYVVDNSVSPPALYLLDSYPQGNECLYIYPSTFPVPAYNAVVNQLSFPNLDVLQFQNALSGAYVKRNELLTNVATSPSFIFQSPETVFAEVYTPYLQHTQSIQFPYNTELSTSIAELFDTLLDPDNQTGGLDFTGTDSRNIKVVASYGYQLVAGTGGSEIVSYLPIAFHPLVEYNPTTFPTNLAQTIENWKADKTIATQGGRYVLDVMVYSTVDTRCQGRFLS